MSRLQTQFHILEFNWWQRTCLNSTHALSSNMASQQEKTMLQLHKLIWTATRAFSTGLCLSNIKGKLYRPIWLKCVWGGLPFPFPNKLLVFNLFYHFSPKAQEDPLRENKNLRLCLKGKERKKQFGIVVHYGKLFPRLFWKSHWPWCRLLTEMLLVEVSNCPVSTSECAVYEANMMIEENRKTFDQ